MILLTDDLRERLLANGRDRDADHVPVVKFFNPLGTGVWLATELDEDGDTPAWSRRSRLSRTRQLFPQGTDLHPPAVRPGDRTRHPLHRRSPGLGVGRGCAPGRQHPRGRAHPLCHGTPGGRRLMRFLRWHRPELLYGYAAQTRRIPQRLEREALRSSGPDRGRGQHGVDEEMARRASGGMKPSPPPQQRAAWWKRARTRLALPDPLRHRIREIWRTCPYPADPASFADFCTRSRSASSIPTAALDLPSGISARLTRNPTTFDEAFRQIGADRSAVGRRPHRRRATILRQSRLRHPVPDLAGPARRPERELLHFLQPPSARPYVGRAGTGSTSRCWASARTRTSPSSNFWPKVPTHAPWSSGTLLPLREGPGREARHDGRIVWQGPEEKTPPRFLQQDLDLWIRPPGKIRRCVEPPLRFLGNPLRRLPWRYPLRGRGRRFAS